MPQELFDTVDENDRKIGKATRERCHAENLIHRSVMFFVLDGKGRVLVTKRTEDKDFFPGYWSITLGGHVLAGETYEEAAKREIEEEIGLSSTPFFIESFPKRIPEERENVKVFGVVTKEDIKLEEAEIAWGDFLEMDELKEKLENEKFLPETEVLLKILKGYLSSRKLQNI